MAKSRRPSSKAAPVAKPQNVFDQRNYMWLLIGVLCIAFGFTAMRIENEIRGFVSLYIAPVVILAGFAIVAWAILLKPREAETTDATLSQN